MTAPRSRRSALERQAHRRARAVDAARLLPVAGTVALVLPVLWAGEGAPASSTAGNGLYVFAVWALLILCAGLLGPRLAAQGEDARG